MSDKERLEDIKNFVKTINGDFTAQLFGYDIKPKSIVNDFKWLIQQAERVQELEELIEDYKTVNKELHQRGRKVRKQNKRYREALEEIKKEETVTTALSEGQVAYTISGHIARKALEGTK